METHNTKNTKRVGAIKFGGNSYQCSFYENASFKVLVNNEPLFVSFKEDNRLFIHKETVSTYSSLKWVLSDKECGAFLCRGRTRKEVIEKYHEIKKKYEEIYHKQMHLRLIKEFKELGGYNE